MDHPPSRDRRGLGDEPSDEGLLSTIDAASTITPDPFLAEVARIPERAAVPEPEPMLRPGDALGHFVVRGELGRGGMGVVYAALDQALGREVALKVMPLSGDAERRRRFLREARSAAGLSHPGIATIYEVGEVGGRAFIALELVRGVTLRSRLDQVAPQAPGVSRSLPLDEALRITTAITRALAKAHGRGVIHRDLKPENVMIAEDGAIKLLDFGLAKLIDAALPGSADSTTTTQEGRILGTPSYMSPEQARGRTVDARSDVFSLGVMLYEMMTGTRPFASTSLLELFAALDRDAPQPPSRANPGVSAALERVVLRCLEKAPAARYADAGELLRDLEHARDLPTPEPGARVRDEALPRALAESADEPAPRVAHRRRRATIAAAVVAAAALTAVFLVLVRPRDRAADVPVAAAAVAPTAPVPTALTALPVPINARPEAIAAYRKALEASRSGAEWQEGYLRTVELDPSFATAHARLVTLSMVHMVDLAREHYREAQALRDALTPRDREMIDALEPLVQRQPADWAETNRRIRDALERYPADAELWWLLGVGSANFDDFAAGVRAMDRAIAIDPGFARAHASKSTYLAYLGRFAEARVAIDRCLAEVPASVGCLEMLGHLRGNEGDCEGVEAAARRMIAAGIQPSPSYFLLAEALASRGQPMPTVREALRLSEQTSTAVAPGAAEASRADKKAHIWHDMSPALLAGDFEAAEHRVRELERLSSTSRRQVEHGSVARMLAAIAGEVGRDQDAARIALDFLDRRDAWEPEPNAEDVALAGDATPPLLLAALRGGAITRAEFAVRRDTWLRGWTARLTPVSKPYLWLYGYAAVTADAEGARRAFEALPSFEPLPPFRPLTLVDASVGLTYLHAGRTGEAITWLEQATKSCTALQFPVKHTQAHLWLGQAREAAGDKPGACAAYQVVLARWGRAKPRSVTADKARERVRALACAK
jgi:serine/threonine-protein kinase